MVGSVGRRFGGLSVWLVVGSLGPPFGRAFIQSFVI